LCSSDFDSSVCDVCQRDKSHQLPYSHSHCVSTTPLELVHIDVWGPALPPSRGYKYYVSFVDDYSRHCWIYLIKHKSSVEEIFYLFQTHVERFLTLKSLMCSLTAVVSIIASMIISDAREFVIVCPAPTHLNRMVLLNVTIDILMRSG
jgi:hypothetical protein